MTLESETERAQREHRRVVFDNAAERYDATRSGYPEEIVSRMLATAGLETGGRVLEIGCATGQLTRGLTDYVLEISQDFQAKKQNGTEDIEPE